MKLTNIILEGRSLSEPSEEMEKVIDAGIRPFYDDIDNIFWRKKTKPIAIINSLTIFKYIYLLIFGLIDLPKNLKKSLSGDKTNEVSPPIKAFSYACIAL